MNSGKIPSSLWNLADEVIDSPDSISWQDFSGANILVTGCCGFLGGHLLRILLRLNDRSILQQPLRLTGLDSLRLREDLTLQELSKRTDFQFLSQDVCQPDLFSQDKIANVHWNFIFHAASIASPTFYRKFPIETIDSNVLGLKNMLELAKQKKEFLKSFLFFSSSEIYGNPDAGQLPLKESYSGNVDCTNPRACYAESKRLGETYCLAYHQQFQLPVKIARPFNNYGPGMAIEDRRVIPDFSRDLLRHSKIQILSDGSPTRSYCYVADALIGYFQLLLSKHNGIPVNIGNDGEDISVQQLAKVFAEEGQKILAREISIHFSKSEDPHYLTGNPERRRPSIHRARDLLNYEPRTSLSEGIRKTLNYYREASL